MSSLSHEQYIESTVIKQKPPRLKVGKYNPNSITLAVVTETWHPDINGVALSIGKIITGLLDLGVTIHLYYVEHDNAKLDDRIKYYPLKGLHLPFYKEVQVGLPCTHKLYNHWKETPPDIVQVVTEGPLGYSAIKAASRLGIPAISDYHTNFQQYSRSYRLGILENLVLAYLRGLHNRTKMTLVPTRQLQMELTELGFDNVRIMSRGIDTEVFNPCHCNPSLRHAWGLNDDDIAVLYVGRLAAEKNLALAVEAFRGIQAVQNNARFILVGSGPVQKKLQQEYPDFIFCGMQTGQALSEHYASCNVFLSPSTTETFGNIVLEAMASGLAVVSFNYAAAREYIVQNSNGVIVPLYERETFVEQAKWLVSNPELIKQMGENAHLTFQNNSWKKVSENLVEILYQCINEEENEVVTT